MKTILEQLRQQFRAAIQALYSTDADPVVVPTQNEKFGDYQCNAAMALAKAQKLKPRDVAEAIKAHIGANALIDRLEVAGPGFINIFLAKSWLENELNHIQADPRLGVEPVEHPQTVVIDYSGPNVAKEMHVGHLRSTVIGDAVARVLGFQGQRVIRQNHIGDFGTQFGMLIHHMRDTAADGKPFGIEDLDRFYKEATARFRADPQFKETARKTVVELQTGGESAVALWNRMKLVTHSHYTAVYRALGVTLTDNDERPESFYRDRLQPTIDAIKAALPMTPEAYTGKGPADVVVADEDDDDAPAATAKSGAKTDDEDKWTVVKPFVTVSGGATCVFLPNWIGRDKNPLPMMIQKSDGGFPYSATDLAALRFRVVEPKTTPRDQAPLQEDWRADRVIYFTDARQSQHFAMVFDTFRAAGWDKLADGRTALLEHAPFGSMTGPDGKPFKTRSGDTAKLAELIDEAEERALKVVNEKNADLPLEQRQKIARAVGIGAVKYADLSKDRNSDYVFDWDKMLAMNGNTAPYLQYAHARIRSIFRKSGERASDTDSAGTIRLEAPQELALAKHLLRFGEVLDSVARELKPHLLCAFLYDLATKFSGFYENCPVLKSDEPVRSSRLALCDLTARTLAVGLDLLGIEHPEQM